MTCTEFRASFAPGTEDASVLEHLRSCDACLDHAAHVDPEVMFRALGGAEMVPPGGVDAFVADVMNGVQLRSREGQLARPASAWSRKLALAATLALTVTGASFFYRGVQSGVAPAAPVVRARLHPAAAQSLTTKPVVETYSSANATIVEMPNAGDGDVQLVMIFDESLPADL